MDESLVRALDLNSDGSLSRNEFARGFELLDQDGDMTRADGSRTGRLRLSFIIPLAGFLILAAFATVALMATLRGERDQVEPPSAGGIRGR